MMAGKNKVPLIAAMFGSGFGTGYCPVAPGTAGALLALLLWVAGCFLFPEADQRWTTFVFLLLSIPAGIISAGILEKYWGKDPSRVTIDEMAGTWIGLLAVPSGNYTAAFAAFVLFRFLDIFKPLGIRKMEKFKGGWGIMMDDILAGLYTYIAIRIVLCIIP